MDLTNTQTDNNQAIKNFEIEYWCNYIAYNYHTLIRQTSTSIKVSINTLTNLGECKEEINQLNILFKRLRKCLENYIGKEEHILFTYIKKFANEVEKKGYYKNETEISLLNKPLEIIKDEREKMLMLIIQIRELTNNYNAKVEWTPSHKNCYQLLSQFDRDLKHFFYIEETTLLPKIKKIQEEIMSKNNTQQKQYY